MARGKSLLSLLDDLRAEARLSQNVAHNVQGRESQVKALQREQERLWEDFDWPHMRVERQVPLVAGQRYYGVPSDLSLERIEQVQLFVDGSWMQLTPGISGLDYGAWNSDLGEQSWPPRCWRLTETGDVEIWPISNQAADTTTRYGYLKFIGIRNLNPLVNDADTADLDSRLIVGFVATAILAAAGAKDAQLKLSAANRLYAKLRGNLSKESRFQMFGTGTRQVRRRSIVHYRPAGS